MRVKGRWKPQRGWHKLSCYTTSRDTKTTASLLSPFATSMVELLRLEEVAVQDPAIDPDCLLYSEQALRPLQDGWFLQKSGDKTGVSVWQCRRNC